ncbi:MAG: PDZ domain-containing protein [Planctomycetes bacterium]|nr:PDZ domain-containing protein [Planctomycetota bacterium]
MKAPFAAALAVSTLVAGFAVGVAVGRQRHSDEPVSATSAVEAVERERDEALARAQRAETALQAERRKRADVPAAARPSDTVQPTATDPAPVAPASTLSDSDRAQQVRDLAAQIEPAVAHADGEKLLELLRRLSALSPEGRTAAMELALKINDDVNGEGLLRLDQYTFYTSLGDTGVRTLMIWSLDNPSPAAFRVLSAWSLPWVIPKEQAIDTMGKSLVREKEVTVQQALVVNLAQMNDSRAESLLATILADPARDAGVRAQIATSLATTTNADLARALETTANTDPDDRVRAAARAAIVARNPPVDGFLITIVFPDGAASAGGIRPGDILISYDGHATRDLKEVRDLIDAESSAENASAVVLRDGIEVTLPVRRGRLGIQGRAVRRK